MCGQPYQFLTSRALYVIFKGKTILFEAINRKNNFKEVVDSLVKMMKHAVLEKYKLSGFSCLDCL